MRTFEYREGESGRFWSVQREGTTLILRSGKIGSRGRTYIKRFSDEKAAEARADKLARHKLAAGFVETTPRPSTPAPTIRDALESALAANSDDLAAHMAYADYLQEQGDPRGEFIRVQLALEDESVPTAERQNLRQRERELLHAHQSEWLGELAPLLLGTAGEQRALFAAELLPGYGDRLDYTTQNMHFRHAWSRGWLDRFECDNIGVEMARQLGRFPIARLLRALVLRGDEQAGVFRYALGPDIPREYGRFRPCEVLAHYPAVANVKVFQYGLEADPEEDTYHAGTQFDRLAPLVERMPRLEELHIFGHIYLREDELADLGRLVCLPTLTHLRIFQHYHGHTYPLEMLAANAALSRLTHLLCFPHSFAAEYDLQTNRFGGTAISRAGVRAVVASPHLRSLTHLQLRSCDGGDEMVADIISSGILKRLEMLDLRHGRITDAGARLLADCPDIRNLKVLDLINNRLTETGIAALRAAGIPVRCDRQQGQPYDDDQILYVGDSE
jgi:uncharacterized protein (TIGR02996 family)